MAELLVIPMPVRDHLRFTTLEWSPVRVVRDTDAVERQLLADKEPA
jgi:hypothetical protein